MSDPIATFFSAWQLEAAEERQQTITSAVAANVDYVDPNTPQPIGDVGALCDYVGMFSANAPGWSAKVVKSDSIGGMTRATVAFGGKGPDGNDMVQLGQYFVETDGALITRMVGFVGTGAME